jgi:hypothetical protein
MVDRELLPVQDFSLKHRGFPKGALRKLIFESKPRVNSKGEVIPGNGFARAIRRIGRPGSKKPRVLIDVEEFFAVIDEMNDARDTRKTE